MHQSYSLLLTTTLVACSRTWRHGRPADKPAVPCTALTPVGCWARSPGCSPVPWRPRAWPMFRWPVWTSRLQLASSSPSAVWTSRSRWTPSSASTAAAAATRLVWAPAAIARPRPTARRTTSVSEPWRPEVWVSWPGRAWLWLLLLIWPTRIWPCCRSSTGRWGYYW